MSRPEVDEQVETEPESQQDVPGVPSIGNAGVAYRPEQDPVEVVSKTGERLLAQRLAEALERCADAGARRKVKDDFDAAVRVDTLDATDLMIDGVAATSVTVVDGDSAAFTLP